MEGTPPSGLPEDQVPTEPAKPPEPPKPVDTPIECGACHTQFTFPIVPGTQSFKFNCTKCGALNEVAL